MFINTFFVLGKKYNQYALFIEKTISFYVGNSLKISSQIVRISLILKIDCLEKQFILLLTIIIHILCS